MMDGPSLELLKGSKIDLYNGVDWESVQDYWIIR